MTHPTRSAITLQKNSNAQPTRFAIAFRSIDLLQKSIFSFRGVSEAVARNERQHLRLDLSVKSGFISANALPL